jgi:hypothetical protein
MSRIGAGRWKRSNLSLTKIPKISRFKLRREKRKAPEERFAVQEKIE